MVALSCLFVPEPRFGAMTTHNTFMPDALHAQLTTQKQLQTGKQAIYTCQPMLQVLRNLTLPNCPCLLLLCLLVATAGNPAAAAAAAVVLQVC